MVMMLWKALAKTYIFNVFILDVVVERVKLFKFNLLSKSQNNEMHGMA